VRRTPGGACGAVQHVELVTSMSDSSTSSLLSPARIAFCFCCSTNAFTLARSASLAAVVTALRCFAFRAAFSRASACNLASFRGRFAPPEHPLS